MKNKEELISKNTPTDFDIHPLIKERWSPRMFSEIPLSDIDLQTLFEAGRWSASSNNFQPWRIIWGAKGSETYDRIFQVLSEFNQSWVKNAPILMLGAYYTKNPNTGQDNFHALHDLGLFMGNVSIQAQSMGIAMHQMAGVKHQDAHSEFKFPEDYHVATAVALGYYGGDAEELPEDLRKMELDKNRKRMKQDEFIFNGDFIQKPQINK